MADDSRGRATAVQDKPTPKPATAAGGKGAGRGNPFTRVARFYREVVAELRKVLWPTRRELIGYTFVVMVFVSVMVALVAGLDYVFTKGVLAAFG
jgi:preprotein translocase subunit SecE